MPTLPFALPKAYKLRAGSQPSASGDVDTGGYDVLVGGHGFRLATDKNHPYERATEQTTVRRFDSSLEPGEQTLSQLPWLKSQSSFHAGAGQINLEQGFTAFQYQAEQVEHIRYWNSLGVDPWTPGQVSRLPDCHLYNFGFTSSCMVTASLAGVDYAIVGGVHNLEQLAWTSGPDVAPVATSISLSDPLLGGASNCTVSSLCTDGRNYYALIHLASAGSAPGVLTYIARGQVDSAAAPTLIYQIPSAVRQNLCTNPSFETGTTSWSPIGASAPTVSTSTSHKVTGTQSMTLTWTSVGTGNGVQFTLPTTVGKTYTVSVYLGAFSGNASAILNITNGGTLSGTNDGIGGAFVRVNQTFTATSTSSLVQLLSSAPHAVDVGATTFVDSVLIEQSSLLSPYFDGATAVDSQYSYAWDGTANASTSTATPTVQNSGVIGWSMARLIGALGSALYELSANTGALTSLPSPKYSHPNPLWQWTAIAESPNGVLASGQAGQQSSILEFTLDASGAVPVLAGGKTVATLPPGEIVQSLDSYLASFLGIGTSYGVRVGTFDTYTGALKMGPTSLSTTSPVYGMCGRDRFIYASYSNQQADGKTGLARIDLSMVTDTAGRNAWAPDLRPPTTAPTGLGTVTAVGLLPTSNRVVFVTAEGIHTEGNGPGSDGNAWIQTSRIRYDTAELKLFKLGRLHGSLSNASIQVDGIAPYRTDANLGTFGFITATDPGEFRLPTGLNEWIALRFTLNGSTCQLNSYQVKALPAPKRQHLITFTVNCFRNEVDKYGLDVTDPETPRTRYQNVKDLESIGDEVRLVEFTNQGAVSELVVIDQLAYESQDRPTIDDDFGGTITFRLRATES